MTLTKMDIVKNVRRNVEPVEKVCEANYSNANYAQLW